HANSYTWSVTGSITGTGTLTTGALCAGIAGCEIVDSISGQFAGSTITGILAAGSLGNDNRLFPGSSHLLDTSGLSFAFGSASSATIWCCSSTNVSFPYFVSTFNPTGTSAGQFSLAVPGPIAGAGLPGLILAGGGLLGWLRRRKAAINS